MDPILIIKAVMGNLSVEYPAATYMPESFRISLDNDEGGRTTMVLTEEQLAAVPKMIEDVLQAARRRDW